MNRNRSSALFLGWSVILFLMIIASIIFALLLRYTSIAESTISILTSISGLLILAFGAIIAGRKAKEKGWLIGIIISLGFSLFVFLYQYLGYQQTFSLQQYMYHGSFLIASMLGAVIGVNLADQQET